MDGLVRPVFVATARRAIVCDHGTMLKSPAMTDGAIEAFKDGDQRIDLRRLTVGPWPMQVDGDEP